LFREISRRRFLIFYDIHKTGIESITYIQVNVDVVKFSQ